MATPQVLDGLHLTLIGVEDLDLRSVELRRQLGQQCRLLGIIKTHLSIFVYYHLTNAKQQTCRSLIWFSRP